MNSKYVNYSIQQVKEISVDEIKNASFSDLGTLSKAQVAALTESQIEAFFDRRLILPFTDKTGATYLILDSNKNGLSENGLFDTGLGQNFLAGLLNNGNPVVVTNVNPGVDDARSVIFGTTQLVLPTFAELKSLFANNGISGSPGGTLSNGWTFGSLQIADMGSGGTHQYLDQPFFTSAWNSWSEDHPFFVVFRKISLTPSYAITAGQSVVNEGSTASFNLLTKNIASGTKLNYSLSGVTASDITSGSLTGTVTVDANGAATITVPVASDRLTEGKETMTVSVQGVSASTVIQDTSTQPVVNPETGNYYELVVRKDGVSWEQAKNIASGMYFNGVQGYLATITSANEDSVAFSVVAAQEDKSLYTALGGTDEGSEGNWRWATGPENGTKISYSNWAPGEPNNGWGWENPSQNVMAYMPVSWSVNSYGKWDDGWTDPAKHGQPRFSAILVEYGVPKPKSTYDLKSSASSVDEGSTAIFTLKTANVAAGTVLNYTLAGVTSDDIVGGGLSGVITVNNQGTATITVPIAADKTSDGPETMTVTVESTSASVIINDTKETTPNHLILPSAASVDEGNVATFTVQGTNVRAGSSAAYRLSGLNAEDITGGQVNGRITFDDLGMATVTVPIAADNKTEGSESLTVTVGSATSTITVNDTSKSTSQYYLSASDGIVDEGKVATFTISAEDAKPGTKIPYTISGSGITAKDIVNGKLSGSVAVGADNSATITIPIAADKLTEGDEDLTVTLTGLDVSETITIEDTSTAAVAVPTYTLEANESSIKEGESAEFLLETTGVTAGTKLKYTISGVSNADLANKKLTGTVEVSEDGSATITIPTASDALTEGSETLTLTVNGQKASVVLLDDNSVNVSETVLEGSEITLYKASLGGHALAAPGLKVGDALDDFVPLKASAIKDYALPKGLSAVLGYEDGSFGLIIKTGTGSKASFSEQKFSEDGIAKGKLAKLSAAQVLAKETTAQTDLNGDGVIGEVITEVYDSDGDANQQDYGLYKTSSGAVVLGAVDQAEGDKVGVGVALMASKTKGWVVPSGTSVSGIAITDGGSLEVLTLKGKQYSAQKFDPETGLIKGKVIALKTAQLDAREYYYEIDLTGDGDISLVGQENIPVGWNL